MKRYIKASVELDNGSYLLNRDGDLEPVNLHVPSTTYISRGINHLCCTDAQFLLDKGRITEDEAKSIALYCLYEYIVSEVSGDEDYVISLMDISAFNSYAELRYAKDIRNFIINLNVSLNELKDLQLQYPDFNELNNRWYTWLSNQFVKVSVFNNQVEFRICSEDGFDWNEVIIDDCILTYDEGRNPQTRYNIVRESSKGYKAYFLNATITDILESDTTILSSKLLTRHVINGKLIYR